MYNAFILYKSKMAKRILVEKENTITTTNFDDKKYKLIEKEIDLAQLLYQETNFKEKLLQYFHLRKCIWTASDLGQFMSKMTSCKNISNGKVHILTMVDAVARTCTHPNSKLKKLCERVRQKLALLLNHNL